MSPIIWENCRRNNGTLDLRKAASHTGMHASDRVLNYLETVEKMATITSRQVAAVAIASAFALEGSCGHQQESGS